MQGKDVCLRICVDVRGEQRSNLSEICYFCYSCRPFSMELASVES